MEQLESARLTVERAFYLMKVGSVNDAERELIKFKNSPNLLFEATYILEQPSSSSEVCFQAAGALVDFLQTNRTALDSGQKGKLLSFSVNLLFSKKGVQNFVYQKLVVLSSAAFRLLWPVMDTQSRASFFEYIDSNLRTESQGIWKWVFLLLDNIVAEFFSFDTNLWTSTELHSTCKAEFENYALPRVFQLCRTSVERLIRAGADDGPLLSGLQLFYTVLSWAASGRSEPSPLLMSALSDSVIIHLMVELYKKQSSSSEISSIVRRLTLLLCSVVVTLDESSRQNTVFSQLLGPFVLSWFCKPEELVWKQQMEEFNGEFADGCAALQTFASGLTAPQFDKLVGVEGGGLSALLSLTFSCLRSLAEIEADCQLQAPLECLLQAWASLVQRDGPAMWMPQVSAISQAYVQASMAAASASSINEEEDYFSFAWQADKNEILEFMIPLLRASAPVTFPFLSGMIQERRRALPSVLGPSNGSEGGPGWLTWLEECVCLLLIAGYSLADSGAGEVPEVPVELSSVPAVRQLSLDCLLLVSHFAQAGWPGCTPRFMESVVWFLARWADSYLMVDLGADDGGWNEDWALSVALEVVPVALGQWPGETGLQDLTCSSLLVVLTKKASLRRKLVLADGWQRLNADVRDGSHVVLHLPGPLQGQLAQIVAYASPSSESFHSLVQPVVSRALEMMTDVASKLSHPGYFLEVESVVERLRGFVRACQPAHHHVATALGVRLQAPSRSLLGAAADAPLVSYLILQFWAEWVDSVAVFLTSSERAQFWEHGCGVVEIYSRSISGKLSGHATVGQQQSEQCDDLRVLLTFLKHAASRDIVQAEQSDLGGLKRMVGHAMTWVMRLLTPELLRYPKLCSEFFELLENLFVHPETMVNLDVSVHHQLLQALEWGMEHEDSSIVLSCLSSVRSLALCQWQSMLSARQIHFPSSAPFVVKIFQVFAKRRSSEWEDMFEAVVLAMFTLLLLQWPTFQTLVERELEVIPDGRREVICLQLESMHHLVNKAAQSSNRLKTGDFAPAFRSLLTSLFLLTNA